VLDDAILLRHESRRVILHELGLTDQLLEQGDISLLIQLKVLENSSHPLVRLEASNMEW